MRVRSSLLLAVSLSIAAVLLAGALLPARYAATARVLLPRPPFDSSAFVAKAEAYGMTAGAEAGSRVLRVQHVAADPARAAAAANEFLRAHASKGMLVLDEASVPFAPQGPGPQMRMALGVTGLLLLVLPILVLKSKSTSKGPDRSVVRHALRFARLGQRTLLVDTGTKFRVVLSNDAAAALEPDLKILASLAGGALIVARQLR